MLDTTCPKCGYNDAVLRYQPSDSSYTDEYIRCLCNTCLYVWQSETLNRQLPTIDKLDIAIRTLQNIEKMGRRTKLGRSLESRLAFNTLKELGFEIKDCGE